MTYNQRILNNLSWITRDNPSTCYIFQDGDERRDLNEYYLSEIISNKSIILLLPIHRFQENNYALTIEGPIDGFKILQEIHKFYNEKRVVKKIIKDMTEDDVFGYVSNVKNKINNNEEVHYIDLMGDLVFFEGIRKERGNVYFLELGS